MLPELRAPLVTPTVDLYRAGRPWLHDRLVGEVAVLLDEGRRPGRLLCWAVRASRSWTWRRTWAAEWDGCTRAVRGWTRRGTARKAARVARQARQGRSALEVDR